jgi:hypothetical protein
MPLAPFLPWREDDGLLMQPAEVIRYRLATTRLLDQRISGAGEGWQEAATIEFQ